MGMAGSEGGLRLAGHEPSEVCLRSELVCRNRLGHQCARRHE